MITKFEFYPEERRRSLENYVAEYTFEQPDPTPWTPLRRRLHESTVSVITTAGLRLQSQAQYDMDREDGSPDYREISIYVKPQDLAYDFTNYDPMESQKDLNVLVPLDRLRELVDERVLGGVTETFFSFFGLCKDIDALKENARKVADRIKAQESDIALILTANLICNQTGSIIARELEWRGISTVLLATVYEMTEEVHVPRTAFVNFPFGRPFGKAHDKVTQRAVLDEVVGTLKSFSRPGKVKQIKVAWEGPVD